MFYVKQHNNKILCTLPQIPRKCKEKKWKNKNIDEKRSNSELHATSYASAVLSQRIA